MYDHIFSDASSEYFRVSCPYRKIVLVLCCNNSLLYNCDIVFEHKAYNRV